MGTQRVLAIVGNAIQEYVGLQASAGASSAGGLVALNAAGLVDSTMLATQIVGRNLLINGNFATNQRVYASGTALSAGSYAHDRCKAGAGGCTYTFTQAVPDTAVTITAGTLVQAIEAAAVAGTAYWLSWPGTAQARVWQGSASGAYASSPILVTGLTPGTQTQVEFATGTLGQVQFEAAGAAPTPFERRPVGIEFALCQRYFQVYGGPSYNKPGLAWATSATVAVLPMLLPVPMRAAPSLAGGSNFYLGNNSYAISAMTIDQATATQVSVALTSSGLTTGAVYIVQPGASGTFSLSAEL